MIGRIPEISLRSWHPVNCVVSSTENFSQWEGTSSDGIAMLALAWTYVLNASLAERQGLRMQYTYLSTTLTRRSITVSLKYATQKELLW